MKKTNKQDHKLINTRRLRPLASVDLCEVKGGGVSTSPTGPAKPANPCGC